MLSLTSRADDRFDGREKRMAFRFRLQHEDGTPADPPTLKAAVPDWRAGDTIALGPARTLRVVGTRIEEGSDGTRFPCSWSKRRGLNGH